MMDDEAVERCVIAAHGNYASIRDAVAAAARAGIEEGRRQMQAEAMEAVDNLPTGHVDVDDWRDATYYVDREEAKKAIASLSVKKDGT